jgi:alanyl aminopeptidase
MDWRLLQRPLNLLNVARDYLATESVRPNVERVAGKVLRQTKALQPPADATDPEAQLLFRSAVTSDLEVARTPATREAAKTAGLQFIRGQSGPVPPLSKALLQPTFIDLALNTTLEDAPPESFEAAVEKLRSAADPVVRRNLLVAIGRATGANAGKARELVFDPMIRTSEIVHILWTQSSRPETRDETWTWFVERYDALLNRLSVGRGGALPWLAASFCSEEKAKEVEQFFAPKIATLRGGPRNLASVLEQIRMCAANVQANREDARRYFERVRE